MLAVACFDCSKRTSVSTCISFNAIKIDLKTTTDRGMKSNKILSESSVTIDSKEKKHVKIR